MSPSTSPSPSPNRFRPLSFDAKEERRRLTDREEQIVNLICDGLSDDEVIERLAVPSSEKKNGF